MRLPNLLETRTGRLVAFFFLYVTEGIPLGFAATAVATQLRRQDVGPAEIGAFVASFYLPWAFKWAFGPVVDVFFSEKLGRRRSWILGTQIMLMVTLLSCTTLNLPAQLGLLTVVLLVHNTFGATQDVAIDALAVNTLREDERGLANGVMFAGAAIGQAVGGSGVLFLMPLIGLSGGFVFVAGCIAVVTVFIVLPLREPPTPLAERRTGGLAAAGIEMKRFAAEAFRSFLGTRGAFAGLGQALLPAGAMALGLALQSNLAVELGLDDDQVAWMNVWSSVIGAGGMVLGGMLSDRFGRRRTLAVYLALMSVPTLYLSMALADAQWVMPVAQSAVDRRVAPAALVMALWVAVLAYNFANGLMYGTRSALFMDVTNPKVAATQFTAYMAMMNLAIAYSATWQGIAAEVVGYPQTLLIDSLVGLLCILLLPFMRPASQAVRSSTAGDGGAAARARGAAWGLAIGCLAWIAFHHGLLPVGQAAPVLESLFTLVFVASAVFLAAGALALGTHGGALARAGLALAPLLLAMYLRRWWPEPGAVYDGVALAGALLLIAQSRRDWGTLTRPAVSAAA